MAARNTPNATPAPAPAPSATADAKSGASSGAEVGGKPPEAAPASNTPKADPGPAPAQPAPPQQAQAAQPSASTSFDGSIPGGGISAHEGKDYGTGSGHTVSRHVGRTDDQLKDRLANEPNIPKASTYTDESEANTAIKSVLTAKKAEIEAWLKDSSKPPRLRVDGSSAVGRVMPRGAQASVAGTSVRVILQKAPPGSGMPFIIVTSFPT